MSTARRPLSHPVPFIHGAKGHILRCRSSLVDDDDVIDEFLSARVSARYQSMKRRLMEVRDGKIKRYIEDSAKEV